MTPTWRENVPRKKGDARRRGGVYVAVLGLATLLATLAITALVSARMRNQTSWMNDDVLSARRYADSAIQMGLFAISNDTNWRNTRPQGMWITRSAFDSGGISLAASCPSGNFKNSELEPITFVGTGERQMARQKIQATFVPVMTPLTGLDTALACKGPLTFNLLATLNATNLTVYTGGSCTAVVANVKATIEYMGSCTGASFNGITWKPPAAREIPDAAKAMADSLGKATTIPLASLPKSSNIYELQKVLLTPAHNPYGAANIYGIYKIDCAGNRIDISDMRLVGTLILINPGSGSSFNGSLSIEPAVANQPSVLVDGNMTFNLSNATFKENSTVNFNPAGAPYPYPSGTFNNNKSDTYPSKIAGIVYVNGNVTFAGTTAMSQVLATGTMSVSGTLTLTPDVNMLNSPPAGFRKFTYEPAVDGYVRVVDP